jgi:AraC-like DNA-binding protein
LEIHGHTDYWDFFILTEGSITNFNNDKAEFSSAPAIFFSTAKDIHCIKKMPNTPMRYINIIVREETVKALANAISPTFLQELETGKHSYELPAETLYQLENLIQRVSLLPSEEYELQDKLLCSAVLLILQYLFMQTIEKVETKPSWQLQLTELTRTSEFITYTVSDLCKAMNYSKAHLNRLFKEAFGTSPHEYLFNYKMQYASNLLTNSDLKVSDIATQAGYTNLSQFNVNFKRQFGVSPKNYRKTHAHPQS